MNIGEVIIRLGVLLIIFVVPGFYIWYVYKKTEDAMNFMESETLNCIVIKKRIELSHPSDSNVYELLYFIEVEDGVGESFDVNISSKEYFQVESGSKVKLEFYKNKLIKVKYEKRGKRL